MRKDEKHSSESSFIIGEEFTHATVPTKGERGEREIEADDYEAGEFTVEPTEPQLEESAA